jgi:hypothetical protein
MGGVCALVSGVRSGEAAARSPSHASACVWSPMVTADGDTMMVDCVSILPGVMCSTVCVTGAVDDGMCRCQACVAGVDEA